MQYEVIFMPPVSYRHCYFIPEYTSTIQDSSADCIVMSVQVATHTWRRIPFWCHRVHLAQKCQYLPEDGSYNLQQHRLQHPIPPTLHFMLIQRLFIGADHTLGKHTGKNRNSLQGKFRPISLECLGMCVCLGGAWITACSLLCENVCQSTPRDSGGCFSQNSRPANFSKKKMLFLFFFILGEISWCGVWTHWFIEGTLHPTG